MAVKEITEVIAAIVGIILTLAIIHYTITNRNKTKADNIRLLWERIDALELKLETEKAERDGIISYLQRRISQLETRLREYGVPLPKDEDETLQMKPIRSLGMKK